MVEPLRRAARRAVCFAAPVLGLALLVWTVAEPVDRLTAGRARPDDLAALGAAGGLALLLGWVLLVLVAAAVAAPGVRTGRHAASRGARVAPQAVRRAARALLGASVVAGPPAAVAAVPDVAWSVATAPQLPSQAAAAPVHASHRVPDVGRPVAARPPPPVGRPVTAVSTRPGGWVPQPPEPPPRRARSSRIGHVTSVPRATEAVLDAVVVRRGDTLWGIAARHLGGDASDAEVAAEWPRWYAANRRVVGDDPDLILPGTVLRAPRPAR